MASQNTLGRPLRTKHELNPKCSDEYHENTLTLLKFHLHIIIECLHIHSFEGLLHLLYGVKRSLVFVPLYECEVFLEGC